jgi:argininosuccinate lyase
MAMLSMMKALPLAYNRDMQEDKALLFDTADILSACIEIHIQMLPKLKLNKPAMRQAAGKGFSNATDLADYLVGKGMAFRQAHHCVGQAVSFALDQGKELHELTIDELQAFSEDIKEDIFDLLSPRQVAERRSSFGGTGSKQVKAAIKKAEKQLAEYIRKFQP